MRRCLTCGVVALLSLVLAASAAGARRGAPRASTASLCDHTWVRATVKNETKLRMDVQSFRHGITNAVCEQPGTVKANSQGTWKVGDNLFNTEVTIVYTLENGDQVQFRAVGSKGVAPDKLGCSWVRIQTPTRSFDCAANWVYGGTTGQAEVQLRVFPVPQPPARPAVAASSAAPDAAAACGSAVSIRGSTRNLTGAPLTPVDVTKGAGSTWCDAVGDRPIRPHATDRWLLGGTRSNGSLRLTYRLPDGDMIQFAASINGRGGTTSCAPIDRTGKSGPTYGCSAGWQESAGHRRREQITFEVTKLASKSG